MMHQKFQTSLFSGHYPQLKGILVKVPITLKIVNILKNIAKSIGDIKEITLI